MSALSTLTKDSREKAQNKKKRKQRAHPNDQKPKKSRNQVILNEQKPGP
jgi:hypothetical protein